MHLILVGMIVGPLFFVARIYIQVARTSEWPRVTADIEHVEAAYRSVDLELTYAVDGHEYSWTGSSYQDVPALRRIGKLDIRYNPDDPSDIYVVPWSHFLVFTGVGTGVYVVLLGIVMWHEFRGELK